jgi:hypothetical protein
MGRGCRPNPDPHRWSADRLESQPGARDLHPPVRVPDRLVVETSACDIGTFGREARTFAAPHHPGALDVEVGTSAGFPLHNIQDSGILLVAFAHMAQSLRLLWLSLNSESPLARSEAPLPAPKTPVFLQDSRRIIRPRLPRARSGLRHLGYSSQHRAGGGPGARARE